jgi:hypothetical protein
MFIFKFTVTESVIILNYFTHSNQYFESDGTGK